VNRREFIGLVGAMALTGCDKGPAAFERKKAESQLTAEELAFLSDPIRRKETFGAKPLVISERFLGSSVRFDNYEWENIHFINCDFVGAAMFDGVLKNVKFEGCGFVGGRWEDKSWENVTFDNCGGRGTFTLYAESGNGVVYNECYIFGSEDAGYESDYCVLGCPGSSRLERCDITGAILEGAKRLTVKDSSVSNVNIKNCVCDGSVAEFFGCKGVGRLRVGAKQKAEFISFDGCDFNVVDFSRLKAGKVNVSNTSGAFLLYGARVGELSFNNVVFRAPSGKDWRGEYWGALGGMDVDQIKIDNCKQEGGGKVDLSGKLHGGEQGPRSPQFSDKKSLVIRHTELHKCDFSVMHIGEALLENVNLNGCRFYKSEIEQLTLNSVSFDGVIDFTEAKVGSVRSAGIVRERQLRIIKDRGQVDL